MRHYFNVFFGCLCRAQAPHLIFTFLSEGYAGNMNHSRNIYLNMHTLEDARHKMLEAFGDIGNRLGIENMGTPQSVGRVLAEPVFAILSSPAFHAAAMDGVAVTAEFTYGASESTPKRLNVGKDAIFINTGHVMPPHTNAVIMIEHIIAIDESTIEIEAPAFPWQNVRRMGEDIVATELLFPRHHVITPYCLGALLAGGIACVNVIKRPRVFILPTGSELVPLSGLTKGELAPGKVIESNSHVLGKMAEEIGASVFVHDIISDSIENIRNTVSRYAKGEHDQDGFDLILILGGSSAGSEDFARAVISELGEVLVHGVTIMPGKPTIIGKIFTNDAPAESIPVFGVPGYPVSAIICFEQFIRPLIAAMQNRSEPEEESVTVLPTKKLASRLGMEEFLRVKLGRVDDRVVATPLPRGAGTITSITEADGIIRIPADAEGVRENQAVPARLLKSKHLIDDTIVVVGSHDNTLDILADLVRSKSHRYSISSSHVGSMGGLVAIRKNLCHIAGTHLLDTADGSYNISYIKKYLPDTPVRLIHLVERDQGLIIPAGNPKQIKGITDLTRNDITFINRQAGSGTRVLLDYHMEKMGIAGSQVKGYENEEYTHMAVSVAVLGGTADAGLGIYAAAKALGLDFIAVATESYDIVIPERFVDTPRVSLLMDIIRSKEFISRASELGGYHTEKTGKCVWESNHAV
jgi:putative molybdopterin biosynthesis protein